MMDYQWQKVFRDGLCPQLPTETLLALRKGLAEDDSRLIQGQTVVWNTEREHLETCLIGYCGLCEELGSKDEVEEFFVRACEEMRLLLPHGSTRLAQSPLIYFWDDTPRAEARALVLEEVDRVLAARVLQEAGP